MIITCKECNERHYHYALGLCLACWRKQYKLRHVVCSKCGKEGKHAGYGMCTKCYTRRRKKIGECQECSLTKKLYPGVRCCACYQKYLKSRDLPLCSCGNKTTYRTQKLCNKCYKQSRKVIGPCNECGKERRQYPGERCSTCYAIYLTIQKINPDNHVLMAETLLEERIRTVENVRGQ